MKTNNNNSQAGGFSLIELLVVLAAIAAVAAIAIGLMSGAHNDVRAAKLQSDVKVLNEAVQVYRANGGSMEGVTTVGAALTKLKTKAASAKVVGLRGAMLDPRFEADMLTASETASSKARALWNEGNQRFVLATTGEGGAERFIVNENAAGEDALTEARGVALEYGAMTNWVWDYADHGLAAAGGVDDYLTTSVSHSGYTSIGTTNTTRLAAPTISVPGGLYGYFEFDLVVELTDTNLPGTSQIFYTLDNSFWHVYTGGSVIVGPDQTLTAYSVSTDAESFGDSDFVEETYTSTFTISGTAGGDFMAPEGPEEMVTNLAGGESGNFFSFGTPAGTIDPSWLLFNGSGFTDVEADTSFLLGSIDYYNGTILTGSQADGVGLSISLGFDGGVQSLDFNFDLELISTANLDTNTDEQNADYVKLGNIHSDVPVELGGVAYNLILEFGETTAGGFSNIDEFHVIEGESASGSLYGRLVEVTEEEG